ncbi:hypothetical protein [Actinophytocola sp.]
MVPVADQLGAVLIEARVTVQGAEHAPVLRGRPVPGQCRQDGGLST